MNQHKVRHPHDRFFKAVFSRKIIAKNFIREYLQKRINLQINIDTLTLIQNDSVDSYLSEYYSDCIYRSVIGPDHKPLFIIFEHKSYPDDRIEEQVESYKYMIIELYEKSNPGSNNTFFIIPVIIYHGSEKWDKQRSVFDLNSSSYKAVEKYREKLEYEYFDISHLTDNEIIGEPVLRITFLLMKYIHSLQLEMKIEDIFVLFNEIPADQELKRYINEFSRYIESASDRRIKDNLMKKMNGWLSMEDTEWSETIKMVTQERVDKEVKAIVDKAIKEAKKEAKEEAKKEAKEEAKEEVKEDVAQRMILNKFTTNSIHTITGIPVEKIEELRRKMKR